MTIQDKKIYSQLVRDLEDCKQRLGKDRDELEEILERYNSLSISSIEAYNMLDDVISKLSEEV